MPSHEGLRRPVAAHVGEDGSQDGDAEDAAELADRVVGARRLALLLRPTAERTTFAIGAKKSAMPTPAMMNGATRSR